MEPLTAGARPRELLVEASNGWTAYFDSSLNGTDAVSTVGYLCEELGCEGVAVDSVPTTPESGDRPARFGGVQFQLFGPERREFLNYVRTVSVTYDGERWEFSATGDVQPFEETETYRERRIRDRFTAEMLERYCRGIGIDVFNPKAYGPRAVLVTSDVAMPPNGQVLSLADAQKRLGIEPGS